jgi:hypothetical protein
MLGKDRRKVDIKVLGANHVDQGRARVPRMERALKMQAEGIYG